jgi:transposase InsO family protein
MLEDFLKNAHVINSITMDSGSEFTNLEVVTWFEDHEIETYYVVGDSHKLGIINRFHRTLKDKLLKHFLSSNSNNWINDIIVISTLDRKTGISARGVFQSRGEAERLERKRGPNAVLRSSADIAFCV